MIWTNKLLPCGVLCPCHSKSMQYSDTCQAMEILNLTNGRHLPKSSTLIYTSRKPVRYTGKLLNTILKSLKEETKIQKKNIGIQRNTSTKFV